MSAHCSVAFLRSLLSETVLVHEGKLKALNFAENHACPRVVKGIGSVARCFQTFTAHLRNSSEKDTHGVAAEKRLLPSSDVRLLFLCLACVGCQGAAGLLPQSGFALSLRMDATVFGSCWFFSATELPHRSASGLLLHARAIMFSALAAALLGRTAVAMRFLDLFRFISAFCLPPGSGTSNSVCARLR